MRWRIGPAAMVGRSGTDSRMDEVFRGQVRSGARFDPSEPAVYDERAWADARAEREGGLS
ncbi:MAG TPA: hypothetical protein VFT42_02395 [Solirubrobacteraceae bacterium]|nr:hypothetical protein [Solirubrobacteraceae bacterium]